ncbi:MAG TPA: cytochrome c biogenesis protein CcsA [Deinococcales bacterium]|nr:cytochrome c biogenesis protein CcsA [Deinococcales bacterium]
MTARGARTLVTILGWGSLAVLGLGLALTFAAPPDAEQGYLSRILPIHVSSSWCAYLSFGVTMIYSLLYLFTRKLRFDRVAVVSAEVGLVFIGFTLFSGSLWGRPTWGAYWVWDARLTTTALMFAVYLGYLMTRGLLDEPHRRARVSAAIGVVASVGVPINYLSVYWWRGLHQTPTFSVAQNHSYLSGNPLLQTAFFVTLAGVQLLYLFVMAYRGHLEALAFEREERELQMTGAGFDPAGREVWS